jgi:hypothetical protein
VYGFLFSRRDPVPWLLGWARFDAYSIVALPVVLAVLEHDSETSLRFGVVIGVVGATAAVGGRVRDRGARIPVLEPVARRPRARSRAGPPSHLCSPVLVRLCLVRAGAVL